VFRGGGPDGIGTGGVSLELTRPDGSVARATTAPDGSYRFCDLPTGTYTVRMTSGLPAGAVHTYDLDGSYDGATSVVLGAADNLDVDFGFGLAAVEAAVEHPPLTPAFTGRDPSLTLLWALALLFTGGGLVGLATTGTRKPE
jgi:hypothetical protein